MSTPSAQIPSAPVPERIVWEGSPSQVINLSHYLLLGLVFLVIAIGGGLLVASMEQAHGAAIAILVVLAVVPLAIAWWKWLIVSNTRYELTTQRLRTRRGVLNKHLDELELYRVRDYKLEQPFFLRLFSLSTVILQTSDKSNQVLVLKAIGRGDELREQMRTYVEEARMRRGVREIDMD